MINHDLKARVAGDMEPKTKLLVAIMGAIGAYIQLEQQSSPRLLRSSPNQKSVVEDLQMI